MGPKTAEKILKDVTDKNLINVVFKEYKKTFGYPPIRTHRRII